MIHTFITALLALTKSWGYLGIFFLMILESSFIPIPSELVIPPAAFLAHEGQMSLFFILLSAIAGGLVGSLFNYYLALFIGKPLIYKIAKHPWARFFFLSPEHLLTAEKYFAKHGKVSTFIGRLLPGIRHLISLPAGFVRMPLKDFLFYTFLGAGIWALILALSGYLVGVYKVFFNTYLYEIIAAIIFVVFLGWVLMNYLKKRRLSKISE